MSWLIRTIPLGAFFIRATLEFVFARFLTFPQILENHLGQGWNEKDLAVEVQYK